MPSSDESSSRKSRSSIDRRKFIQAAGVAGVAGLAGCGGGDGGSGDGSSGDGSSGDGGSGDGSSGDGSSGDGGSTGGSDSNDGSDSTDFSDVSFEYWDTFGVISQTAQPKMEETINQFEEDTGATVNVNWTGYAQLSGTQWVNAFRQGEYPTLYLGETPYNGRFFNWVEPVVNWKDKLDSEAVEAMGWLDPIHAHATGPLQYDQYEVALGLLSQGVLVRRSHLEEAGMSVDDVWPPESYDELIQIAENLKADGPGDWAFEMTGSKFDHNDFVPALNIPQSAENGTWINSDWTDVNWNNEVFIETSRRMQEIQQNFSSPQGPTTDMEPVIPRMANGEVSMTLGGLPTAPILLNQHNEMFTSGEFLWAPIWEGESGQRSSVDMYTAGVTKAPPDADEDEWARKQDAAIELLNRFLSKDFQREIVKDIGAPPVREDVFDEALDSGTDFELVPGQADNKWTESTYKVISSAEKGWSYHTGFTNIFAHIPAPYIQRMLRGEMSPEEANQQIYNECQTVL